MVSIPTSDLISHHIYSFVKGRWKMATLNASGAYLSTTATQLWVPLLACPSCSATTRSSASLANFTGRFSQQLQLGAQLTWKVSSTSSTQALKIRRRGIVKSVTCASQVDTSAHEFHDDGAEVEVRVRIPDGMVGKDDASVSARHVQVDSQDAALFIAVQTPKGPRLIYSAPRLYGQVKSSETVWYIDDDEVVLSLKKMDSKVTWPALEQAWASLTTGVSQLLKGTSIYVVGASSEINWAVARELATGLEYVPLQTEQLIQELTKMSPADLATAEGEPAVTEAESAILDSLNSHVRCVIATLGGSQGLGAQYGNWKSLHAGFTVWLSQTEATDEEAAEEEAAKAKQEGSKAYAQADVVVALAGWDENSAKPAAEGALRALKFLLEGDKELPSKKSLYVRLGARGDWPDIMPPGWNPASGKEEAKSKAYY